MTHRFLPLIAVLVLPAALAISSAPAQDAPPRDNPYDVIGKVFAPFWSVLLAATDSPNKACTMTIVMTEVTGRLPKEMAGATIQAAVEFPDKVKLTAPVLGEAVTVCRNGDKVWALPGAKVEFLLSKFEIKPRQARKTNTPIYLPITPQQAIFLPAIFTILNADVAEVQEFNGENCRVITAALMPELAKAIKSEGFRAEMWVAPGYEPRRFKIIQPDFTATVEVQNLRFGPSLVPATWAPPADTTDIYRTSSVHLDAILFVVMNSLEMKQKASVLKEATSPATAPAAPNATPLKEE